MNFVGTRVVKFDDEFVYLETTPDDKGDMVTAKIPRRGNDPGRIAEEFQKVLEKVLLKSK